MNTTHTLNTSAAIGLAQESTPAQSARPCVPPATRGKTLVLGLLAVASCAALVLVSQAAMVAYEVFLSLNATYNNGSN